MSVNFSGIVPINPPFNNRILLDANYIANVALPNAANSTNTAALNLLVANPFPTTETINVQVVIAAATNTANSKNINAVIQHTEAAADGTANANWVNIATLAVPLLVTADNAGGGNPGGNVVVKLPPNGVTKQFIRAQFTGEANGGNASGSNGTIQLLF